jgi:hypothetical protein
VKHAKKFATHSDLERYKNRGEGGGSLTELLIGNKKKSRAFITLDSVTDIGRINLLYSLNFLIHRGECLRKYFNDGFYTGILPDNPISSKKVY